MAVKKLIKSKLHIPSKILGGKWFVNKGAIRKWADTQEDGKYGILIYPMQSVSLSQLHDLIIEIQTNNKKKGQGDLFG